MNIRDHHSKFGMGVNARIDPSVMSEADTGRLGRSNSGKDGLLEKTSANAASDVAELAAAMSSIAGQLRAAANASSDRQIGFLDALATELESAAAIPHGLINLPKEARLAKTGGHAYVETDTVTAATVPREHHFSTSSELLLSRILDAVSLAMSRATEATSPSAGTSTQNTLLLSAVETEAATNTGPQS